MPVRIFFPGMLPALLVAASALSCGGGTSGQDTGDDDSAACEEPTPYYCIGACRECCDNYNCDDSNDCTKDSCVAFVCRHEPFPDMSDMCDGGICCGGQCRPGGECCVDSDCTGGCSGTARSCSSFTASDQCTKQVDCWWSENGTCYGVQDCTEYWNYDFCEACSCWWYANKCEADSGSGCNAYTDFDTCDYCLCRWYLPGCHGSQKSCWELTDAETCGSQLDCSWSACVDFQCT
jgi:hypothetical protein